MIRSDMAVHNQRGRYARKSMPIVRAIAGNEAGQFVSHPGWFRHIAPMIRNFPGVSQRRTFRVSIFSVVPDY
ncbi:MAG: hypothetical protein ACUVRS_06955 [Armatimonadota bacterium]